MDSVWAERTCTIVTVEAMQEAVAEGEGLYRVQAIVRNVSASAAPAERNVAAYYGKTDVHRLPQDESERIVNKMKVGVGKCWVSNRDEDRVSIQDESGSLDEFSRMGLYVAWSMTFVGSIVGIVMVTVGSQWVHDSFGGPPLGDVQAGREGDEKKRGYLSGEQVRYVCGKYGENVGGCEGKVKEWTCSVCLDGVEDGMENGVIRTVNLPCEHRFHRECIKKWLRRGRAACPLCDWDPRQLFDNTGQPLDLEIEGKPH